ncbi:MAG: FtsX-like permease family protein, partial [Peptococcaceae bacterium]|nr:FtsX-like permease family protein [Peptococcaceae bacterium]
TGYSLAVALAGASLGTAAGILLASLLSRTYARFFNLPETIGGVNYTAILYGFVLSLAVSLAAGLTASRSVAAVSPAESMRPEPPGGTGRTTLEHWAWLWRRLDITWKMSLRLIGRKKGRFGITLTGVVFAVGLLVMSLFSNDSVDYMINRHFHQEQRYDFLVRFAAPVKERELLNISRIDGVVKAEPLFEIPVKMHFNGRSEDDTLVGVPEAMTLKKLTGVNGQPLQVPEEGVLIDQKTAKKLAVRTGDTVEVETLLGLGPSRRASLKIMGIHQQLVGGGTYISLEQANQVLQERGLVSGVMLKADPGRAGLLEEQLNEMTSISSIASIKKELDNLNRNLDSMIYTITVMIAFAGLLGFAIVYNSSVISFAERKREFASLRVMGFTAGEVSGLLLKENLLQSLCGVILGLPFGRLMTGWYVRAVSTDLYSLPVVVYPRTYLLSALGGVCFIMAAHFFAVKGIKQLDLVDVLKNRD